MRLAGRTQGSNDLTAGVAANLLSQFALLGAILSQVEQLEQGLEDPNALHARNFPEDEPY